MAKKLNSVPSEKQAIELNAIEANELRVLDTAAAQALVKKNELEAQFVNSYISYAQASQALTNRIKETAKVYGIDPDDTSKGRWNFDLLTMVFTKVA